MHDKKSIKANNTAVQEKRILAITIVANTFFTIQFMLQGAMAAMIIYLWHINQNIDFLNSYSYYWFLNIFFYFFYFFNFFYFFYYYLLLFIYLNT